MCVRGGVPTDDLSLAGSAGDTFGVGEAGGREHLQAGFPVARDVLVGGGGMYRQMMRPPLGRPPSFQEIVLFRTSVRRAVLGCEDEAGCKSHACGLFVFPCGPWRFFLFHFQYVCVSFLLK